MPLSERGSSTCVGFSIGWGLADWISEYCQGLHQYIDLFSGNVFSLGIGGNNVPRFVYQQAVLTKLTWPTPILMNWIMFA